MTFLEHMHKLGADALVLAQPADEMWYAELNDAIDREEKRNAEERERQRRGEKPRWKVP